MRTIAIAALVLTATGCTWVHMAPGAQAVRVVEGPPAGCDKRGEVAVSVRDSVAFYERNDLRVRDELETLARNEAPGLDADTVSPLGAPVDGEQRFAAWRCGSKTPAPAAPTTPSTTSGQAQTFPARG
ncbi:uncharacterized protein DUF4156 [Luteimonas cucumeris]|uniref:Uncharacterized protein DUF4156 n=1 Tax=Luteimonas cucumeris TaxID=985012 RepID=A0A562LDS3_9GAMM|nr:uncharacterized protein DUF4156 [Luteimonas cucumeris]